MITIHKEGDLIKIGEIIFKIVKKQDVDSWGKSKYVYVLQKVGESIKK